ncbi:EF-hand domain-containing protein [Xanthomonas arboricola]|uniref:EF-hand domain-containing protein n=1 Tax=Xanthomonas arboricola TaxID=56448 RepID=UPI003EB73997
MKNRNRTSLLAATAALAAALALPAMAQSTQQDAAATSAQSGSSATSAAQPSQSGGGQTWASVDTDSDGAISTQEAQVNAGLAQIFNDADSDKNGKLTPDEYKAFVAKQQGGAAGSGSQGN